MAEAFCLCYGLVNSSDKEERRLGKAVVLSVENLAEAAHGFLDRNVLALHTRKLLGNREGLGEEALYFSRAVYDELILLGKLIHTHNSDDVLKLLISLEHLLNVARNLVMLDAHNVGREYSRRRFKRVNRGVNSERCDATLEDRRRVKMREGGRGSRVGKVVGRNVNRLNRGNRAALG